MDRKINAQMNVPAEQQESKFTRENWMFRVGSELHAKCSPLSRVATEEESQIFEEARAYYESVGDKFSLFRLELKMGNIQEAEKIAEEYMQLSEEPNFYSRYNSNPEEIKKAKLVELKKAYILRDLARAKKDQTLIGQAIEKFFQYGDQQSARNDLSGHQAAALAYQEASRLLPKIKKESAALQSIDQFRKVAEDRARAGDRWWEFIALRQIGKLSSDPKDKQTAVEKSKGLIRYYLGKSDLKRIALLTRDISDLQLTEENIEQMEKMWQENIKMAVTGGKNRDIGKSYWQLWKRTKKHDSAKAEKYRRMAIKQYRELLGGMKSKKSDSETRECFQALSELVE